MTRSRMLVTLGGLILLGSLLLHIGAMGVGMSRSFDEIAELKTAVSPEDLSEKIHSNYVPSGGVLAGAAVGVVLLAVGVGGILTSDRTPRQTDEDTPPSDEGEQ